MDTMATEQPDSGLPDQGITASEGLQTGVSADQTSPPETLGSEGEFYEGFDFNTIKGTPLEAAYKEMQGAFTRKMQGFREYQDKIDAYDAFMSNPLNEIQRMAQQYGYQVSRPGEAPQQQQQQEESFQTWDEVLKAAEERAEKRVMDKLSPYLQEVQNTKRQSIEMKLDAKYPDWRMYEDKMTDLVTKHPTLATDIDILYNMALPSNVRESRANQAALQKLRAKTDVQPTIPQSKTPAAQTAPKKLTFDEAVQYAKQQIAKGRT